MNDSIVIKIKKPFTLSFFFKKPFFCVTVMMQIWRSKLQYTPHLKSLVQLLIYIYIYIYVFLKIVLKYQVVLYIYKINSNFYHCWRHNLAFWVKHRMVWIPKSFSSNLLRCQLHTGELLLLLLAWFSLSHLRSITNIFLYIFLVY